jgi:hypothetical protein
MAADAEAGALAGGPGYRATALRPAITRPILLFFIVGDILGGAIYALVGEVGDKVGGAIWTAFALAGVVAAFTAAGSRSRSASTWSARWSSWSDVPWAPPSPRARRRR